MNYGHCGWYWCQKPPNGKVQPPQAHRKTCQKANDLGRAAVGWNGMFGAPAFVVRVPPASADHPPMVPRRHNGRSVGITRLWDHALHNALLAEPRTSGITLPTTGDLHNGPSSHVRHNALSAQRAFVPHLAQQASAQRIRHNALSGCIIRLIKCERRMSTTLPGRRTVWRSAAAIALHRITSK